MFHNFLPTPVRTPLCGLAVAAVLAVATTGTGEVPSVPKGLPKVPHPKDNPPSEAKIALGKQLYWDTRLSRDKSISCASCHDPKKGWSNGERFATGFGGSKGGRSAPTIINAAYFRTQFWDGRAPSLEEQAKGPIQAEIEMNMALPLAVDRINEIEGYRKQFHDVFGADATGDSIVKAIAAYERTILSGDAPYDAFKAGDEDALSESAERGRKLFFGKAHCSACHVGPTFTDNAFHNIGIGMDKKEPDVGRYAVSKLKGDTGAFKTPGLRDVHRSDPYMHDGSLKTLKEVVEHYNKGGIPNPYLDEELFELNLTEQEIDDLVTFLKEGLASKNYPMHTKPELPK